MKKLFLLLGICIIILTGCSSQNNESEAIIENESAPKTEEHTSISDTSPEYKLIGQDYHEVVSQFRSNGCSIYDDFAGIASQKLNDWISNISAFDETISSDALSVQVAYGKENNSFLWCVMFIENDVVIAYHLLTDGKTSIGEYIGGSEFHEINNLQSDPQIKQLLGTNDGQPWDDNFSVRPVYTENDCIAQFNAMKLNWKTGALTSDIAEMAFMDVYVEAIDAARNKAIESLTNEIRGGAGRASYEELYKLAHPIFLSSASSSPLLGKWYKSDRLSMDISRPNKRQVDVRFRYYPKKYLEEGWSDEPAQFLNENSAIVRFNRASLGYNEPEEMAYILFVYDNKTVNVYSSLGVFWNNIDFSGEYIPETITPIERFSSDSWQEEATPSQLPEQSVSTDASASKPNDQTPAAQQEPALSKEEAAQIMLDEAGVLPEFRFDTYTPQVIITGYMKDAMFFVPDEKIALKGYWEADRWNVLDTLYVHEKYHLESGKRYKLKGVLRYDELQQVEIIEEY